jgi:predicted transposase YbfD/YdcC
LKQRGYQPIPLKRVYIPKSIGKLRPLSIPVKADLAMQALHKLALEPWQRRQQIDAWTGMKSVTLVESLRQTDTECTSEKRYYISSLAPDSEKLAHAIRSHWAIENRLHWRLEVSFNEDASRIRTDHAPENMNIVKKIAMNPLKRSLPKKRLKACLNNQYLAEVLGIST